MSAYLLLSLYQFKHHIKSLLFFILLLLCLSWVLQTVFVSNVTLTSVPIALVDSDKSPTSIRVVNDILKKTILNTLETDLIQAETLLKNHKIEAIVHIKPGFQLALMTGQYPSLIDLIYLDRSTSAPALTDVLAGSVLKEACAYNAILLVQRYDGSDEALEAITLKVRSSIEKQEYSVPLDISVQTPAHRGETTTSIPFENQLPIRLAIGYALFSAFMVSALYGSQYAKVILSPIGDRLKTTSHSLLSFMLFSMVTGAAMISLIFSLITFYFYGFGRFDTYLMPLTLIGHFFSALFIWQLTFLILALTVKARPSFYTLLMPSVVLIGLLSGYFWPLDFISKKLLAPLAFLPSIQLLNVYEELLLSQNLVPFEGFTLLTIVVLIVLLLVVTRAVTTLKK